MPLYCVRRYKEILLNTRRVPSCVQWLCLEIAQACCRFSVLAGVPRELRSGSTGLFSMPRRVAAPMAGFIASSISRPALLFVTSITEAARPSPTCTESGPHPGNPQRCLRALCPSIGSVGAIDRAGQTDVNPLHVEARRRDSPVLIRSASPHIHVQHMHRLMVVCSTQMCCGWPWWLDQEGLVLWLIG